MCWNVSCWKDPWSQEGRCIDPFVSPDLGPRHSVNSLPGCGRKVYSFFMWLSGPTSLDSYKKSTCFHQVSEACALRIYHLAAASPKAIIFYFL